MTKPWALALILSVLSYAGKPQHAPLPQTVMTAKTVYIDNQTGDSAINDLWYQDLKEWGRFNVVADPKTAELIFKITTNSQVKGAHTTADGDDTETKLERGSTTTLQVLDPKSSVILWSDTKKNGSFHVTAFYHHDSPGTNAIIKEFRKRIEEQENQQKAQH